ncbi:MAG TPA: NAD(P)-binding protein [Solirubrobacteraceae bacterium]|nr:NAD(P)-binding protein [Solirubrobacteraceae bacterium]
MTAAGGKTKVAVLGGGVGAITAAFELTAPHHGDRYEVTVYQPGWRLGGKCASGRGGTDKRIEEHGLHVWFGFYANAFKMIQRCYDEWEPPEASPIKKWDEAFEQCNDIVLFESWRGEWNPWHLKFPNDTEVPGQGQAVTPWQFLHTLLNWLRSEWLTVRSKTGAPRPGDLPQRRFDVSWLPRLAAEIGRALEREYVTHYLEHAFKVAAAHVEKPAPGDHRHHHVGWVERLMTDFKHWFFRVVLEPWIEDDDVRRFAIMLDFWVTVVTGLVADEVFERGFGVLNDIDLWKWLRRHGAERLTLEHAAFVKALYDLVFAYREGDKRRPDLAAGKALQAMIRIVSEYKGAVLWKMQAGMGDTVFTPLYDVLRRRGVRFRFFHQVTGLGVSADGKSVSSITVQPQVCMTHGRYDPIVTVDGLRCWPSEPKWGQLVDGANLRKRKVNFENECNPLGLKSCRLQAGEDFDEIVLGISVGALPAICGELAAVNPRFRQMLDDSDTVMTEGIQLWLAKAAIDLGWSFETSIATSYVNVADTYSNMSQLIPREKWRGQLRPKETVYLCGVIDHRGVRSQEDADARVRSNAREFLARNAEPVWPKACNGDGSFDWEMLFDAKRTTGEARLDSQFFRANFQPTERYVLTRAGSVSSRLRSDESGFSNLKLAGDWTRNGIDGGSVEAAATSGMQASRAICGYPRVIYGEKGWLVDD